MAGVAFDRASAIRIGETVRRMESIPVGEIPGKRGHKGRGGNSYSYDGPFAVVQKDATNVTIQGYNESEDRYWRNYVDVGLETPLELIEQDLAVAATGWVHLVMTQTAGTYNTPTVAIAATLPAQTNTTYYRRLAYVTFASGAITSVIQWQYGGIDLPGRAF